MWRARIVTSSRARCPRSSACRRSCAPSVPRASPPPPGRRSCSPPSSRRPACCRWESRRWRVGELRGRALLAWLIVCLVWGSTYLAIRVGVESVPPFLMAGVRFTVAGLLLGGIAWLRGERLPARASDWRALALAGVLLLCAGNGLVGWAERCGTAGTASIYGVAVAIGSALFDAVMPGGPPRLCWQLAGGLLLGLLGTVVLTGATPRALLAADLDRKSVV